MALLRSTFFFISGFIIDVQSQQTCITSIGSTNGYYWRDYTGDLPFDALPGGMDAGNSTIYIGQTIQAGLDLLLPGTINPATKTISYEYGEFLQEASATKDPVKILCSQQPYKFKWVPGSEDQFVSTVVKDNMQMITGGYEKEHPVIIGRRCDADEIGRVAIVDMKFQGLYHALKGNNYKESQFQVLLYNPSKRSFFETVIHFIFSPALLTNGLQAMGVFFLVIIAIAVWVVM